MSIVAQRDGVPGKAAAERAQVKIERHLQAAKRHECLFVPFVVESTGLFDGSCFRLVRALRLMVDPPVARDFTREMIGGVAHSLACTRAMAIRNMLAGQRLPASLF